MASWDDSGTPVETAAVQPERGAESGTAVERARRLLKQLFTVRRHDDWPPLPRP